VSLAKNQQQVFDTLDQFVDSTNLRNRDHRPVGLEEKILNEAIKMAQDFIEEAYARKRKLHVRTTVPQALSDKSIATIQSGTFPEVLSNQVMSYLPVVYRWDSLRLKYNDAFLREGLYTKTVLRIKIIFTRLFDLAAAHIGFMKSHEGSTSGKFSVETRDLIREIKRKWDQSYAKQTKIEAIIYLYNALELAHSKTIIKKALYDDFCAKMIKILHVFVIAVRPIPKKRRVLKPKA